MKGKNSWYKIYMWAFFFGIKDTILANTISFVHFRLDLRSTSLTLHCRRIRSWISRSCWGINFTKHLPYSGRWLLGMIWSNSSMYLFPSSTSFTLCSWTSFIPSYFPFFPLYHFIVIFSICKWSLKLKCRWFWACGLSLLLAAGSIFWPLYTSVSSYSFFQSCEF